MPRITLRVIAEPNDGIKTIFDHNGADTVVVYGPTRGYSHVCGACSATLIVGMQPVQIENLVVRCAACGAFNEPQPAPS